MIAGTLMFMSSGVEKYSGKVTPAGNSKTDVYETFRRMLARGEVPDGIDHLLRESSKSG